MPADFACYANASLFADADSNPFAIDPSDCLPADADLLRDAERYLTAVVMDSVSERTPGQGDDLHSVVRLTILETYKRRGYAHTDSPAGLSERQNPAPDDFRETLEDICADPEQHVTAPEQSPVVEQMCKKAASLHQLLPKAEDWESAASVSEENGGTGGIAL